MFRKTALDLKRQALSGLKPNYRFFSRQVLPIPHSPEYLALLEAEFRKQHLPCGKQVLAQGTRLIMCNTHAFHEVFLDAFPMFLKEDTKSILSAYDKLMSKYNQFHANIIEYELNKPLTCIILRTKPNQQTYFIHTNTLELTLKNLHALPDFLKSINTFNPKIK